MGEENSLEKGIEQNNHEIVENKEKLEIERAIELTTKFVEILYDGKVPERVRERLKSVKDKITVSSTKLEEYYVTQGGSFLTMGSVNGVYSRSEDLILLRENANLNTYIHEICHLLSADPVTNKAGLRTNKGEITQAGINLDEAITIFVSTYAERGLNPNNQIDFLRAKNEISKMINLAGSYSGSADTFGNTVSGFTEWGRIKLNDRKLLNLLPEIFKNYFEGHQLGLRKSFDSSFGEGYFDDFVKTVGETSKIDSGKVITIIERGSNEISENIIQKTGVIVPKFIEAIKDKTITNFVYPEYSTTLCRITPGYEIDGKKIEPEIRLNIALRNIFDSAGLKNIYLMRPGQFQAWIIWQSIVYDEAMKGETLSNNDFYTNKTMREILITNYSSQMDAITDMTRGLIGIKIPQDELNKLNSEISARRLSEGVVK